MTTQTLTLTDFLLARIAEDEASAERATGTRWRYRLAPVAQVPGFRSCAIAADERPLEQGVTYTEVISAFVPSPEIDAYPFDPDVQDMATDADVYPATLRPADGEHMARHDPARVLAECEVKRAVVGAAANSRAGGRLDGVLRALAFVYSDHPDYCEEWRP